MVVLVQLPILEITSCCNLAQERQNEAQSSSSSSSSSSASSSCSRVRFHSTEPRLNTRCMASSCRFHETRSCNPNVGIIHTNFPLRSNKVLLPTPEQTDSASCQQLEYSSILIAPQKQKLQLPTPVTLSTLQSLGPPRDPSPHRQASRRCDG